ncbi:hypothetical protein BJG93_34955 [Paraburkholderia sprentiae WSM5005]|uniref:Uncharacterized protein n=1 Tax=Paraburkholderia sprentiae WSM5005 TaxID=754502 RepID=A0A8F4QKM2_9BURK|nr:hypothetical protein [Paraburkholderia sprentiae]QXE07158.1 hypothetical protein BJG93_34955 [Paraburkholderia sprentiae WSM5005]
MGSPVLSKGVWLREGALARDVVVIRSTVESIGAGPSLRTIFIDKNIAAYCRYIGLISLVGYRLGTALLASLPPATRTQCGIRRAARHSVRERLK